MSSIKGDYDEYAVAVVGVQRGSECKMPSGPMNEAEDKPSGCTRHGTVQDRYSCVFRLIRDGKVVHVDDMAIAGTRVLRLRNYL